MNARTSIFTQFMTLHPAAVAVDILTGFGSRVADAWRQKRNRAALHTLSDRMLRDIGISRSEINSVTAWHGTDASRRRS